MNNIHYRHFRETFIAKNYTFCGIVSFKNTLLVGVAICNPQDQFVKATGRETAFAHAHTNTIVELAIPEGEYSGHIFHDFVNRFMPAGAFKSKISLGEITY